MCTKFPLVENFQKKAQQTHQENARLSGCHVVEVLAVVKIVFFKLSESD